MTGIRSFLATLGQDLRYAARGLRKSPAYSVVAVLTLAIGVGANTAMFTVAEAALLRPLPYRDADRVVHLWETTRETRTRQLSHPDLLDVRDGARTLEGAAGYGFWNTTLLGVEGREPVVGGRVSAGFLSTLGVAPARGRDFAPSEDQTDRVRDVVIVSHGFWQRRLGGDPGVVGRTIDLGGLQHAVIGVLPESFQFAPLGEPEILVTLSPSQAMAERRFMHWLRGIARLAPGATLEQANAELEAIGARRAAADTQWHANSGLRAGPIREAIVGGVRPLVVGLLVAVGAVLLIACANVANMTLARAGERVREVGVRVAVGAGRSRLLRQFLTESLLLALAGGAAGLLWAGWGVRAIVATIPADQARALPYLKDLSVHPGVLAFTLGLCLLTAVAFGLAPALRSTGDVAERLRAGGRGTTGRQRLRSVLVVVETALALVLLIAAGLVARSLDRLRAVDAGFDTRGLLTVRVSAPASYDTAEKRASFWSSLYERAAALPGVEGVAAVDSLPLIGAGNTTVPSVVGEPAVDQSAPDALQRTVSADYFRVVGLPLSGGRSFGAGDRPDSPRVVIVNREFERQMLRGASAVGRRIAFAPQSNPFEIVGVVGDERAGSLDSPPEPVVYYAQGQDMQQSASLVLRTTTDPGPIVAALRRAARELEPEVLVTRPFTLEELVAGSQSIFLRRFTLALIGAAAVAALLLAVVGVYGVMAYSVEQRRDEIGIRMAMGARPGDVLRLVLRQGATLASAGVMLGTGLAGLATRSLDRLLYETPASDPGTVALAAAVLGAVALLACAVPAVRAARVDPNDVLVR